MAERLTGWRVLVLMMATAGGAAGAQSLAHKGWAGNGIVVAPWWQGAVFYRLGDAALAPQNAEELAGRLDEVKALGADALVVPAGLTDEVFDGLVREATLHRLRVVVDVAPEGGADDVVSRARAWLNRGVAGVRLLPDAQLSAGEQARRATTLEHVTASFPGQRVLLWDGPEAAPARTGGHGRRGGAAAAPGRAGAGRVLVGHGMAAWPELDAAGLRRVLQAQVPEAQATRQVTQLVDGDDLRVALVRVGGEGPTAKRVAAAMMLGGEAPLLYAGEEGSGELAAWYRRLGEIRHDSAAVREGRLEVLDLGENGVVAWVWRARAGGVVSPAVVVVVNFSDRPVRLGMTAALARAGVTAGSGELRTLAATATEAETMTLASVGVEAGGSFVGEVKALGLEAAPEAPMRHRRR